MLPRRWRYAALIRRPLAVTVISPHGKLLDSISPDSIPDAGRFRHSEILPGADSIFSGQPVCLSKKPSHNCRDLPDYFRVNPIPELLRGEPPAGIGADDEIALMQSTTTTQVAAASLEKKTQRRLAGGLGLGGILDAAVDDNKCRVN